MRPRVVLDTNLYVSALISPAGRNARMWEEAKRATHLLVSPAIITELATVLRRRPAMDERAVRENVRRVLRGAELLQPRTVLEDVVPDPEDKHILECAVDGKADLIVSNDHHLLKLGEYTGIPIIAGPDFRRMLGVR